MKAHVLPTIGVGVAVAALALAFSNPATATSSAAPLHMGGSAVHLAVPSGSQSCYTNMGPDASEGINSQIFEKKYTAYNSSGAADFTVKTACTFSTVMAPGRYYNGTGPARSETVTVYRARNGQPGKVINTQTVKGQDKKGSFTIPVQEVSLAPGRYFVGVQANMGLVKGGQWGWEVTTVQRGSTDLWANPGGAMGVCPDWTDVVTCFASNGPDYMVALLS